MQGGYFFKAHPLNSLSLVWIACKEVRLLQVLYLRERMIDLSIGICSQKYTVFFLVRGCAHTVTAFTLRARCYMRE